MANSNNLHNDLFSSLISDIKIYTGKDPLLPWLRGIRKMKDSLPPQLLKQKLPRFLQKCAQTFEIDRRYTNDLRYLRVWLQLMDFVDDPRAVLRIMDANRIGMKRSLFYQAYALYYEKMKKFEEAEKMYRLGVQNLAEPVDELLKSYEQFLHRMGGHKNKKTQCQGNVSKNRPVCAGSIPLHYDQVKGNKKDICRGKDNTREQTNEPGKFATEDTVVVKFVGTAIVGKSEAEDARHHGLVEPTINTKEVMNAINSMFREPLEPAFVSRGLRRNHPRADQSLSNGFEVFIDENLDNGVKLSNGNLGKDFLLPRDNEPETHQLVQEPPLEIFIDDEESTEVKMNEKDNSEQKSVVKTLIRGASNSSGHTNGFVFPSPKDLPPECSEDLDVERTSEARFGQDTVVYRFVESTISDEPEVENVCHHGLVEPTVNLKDAMNDINSMFGKPIDFVRKNRPKKQDKSPEGKRDCGGFLILPDDDIDHEQGKSQPCSSANNESDLFELTVCTKDAMAEINKMFGMPLDF